MQKLIIALCLIAGAASAQQTTYSDASGRVVGYGFTNGIQTTYSDSAGRVVGYGAQVGNQTTVSNGAGQVTGYSSQINTNPNPQSNPYQPQAMPGGLSR
jgi:hypothetical protein